MKKTNDTKTRQTWQKIGTMADAQIQKPEAPQQPEPPKENSANKRKGKAKK